MAIKAEMGADSRLHDRRRRSNVSPQRLWQRNMTEQGLCCQCAEPASDGIHCEACPRKAQERGFIKNRLRQGIPLDWPKWVRWKGPRKPEAPKAEPVPGSLDAHLSRIFGKEAA